MKIFLDTTNIDEIKYFNSLGLVDGVTTNPTLMAQSALGPNDTVKQLLDIVDGPISLEVISNEVDEMIHQGRFLKSLGKNVVVKLPITPQGLEACRVLRADNIPVNMTLCFSLSQAFLAAKVGATYVSPFLGRLEDAGQDIEIFIRSIVDCYRHYGFTTNVLAASIRHVGHVELIQRVGVDAVTLPPNVLHEMIKHPLTKVGLEKFLNDWDGLKEKNLYSLLGAPNVQ
jgi:transaldolase